MSRGFVRSGECDLCCGDHVRSASFQCERCGRYQDDGELHAGLIDNGSSGLLGAGRYRSGVICEACARGG